MFLQVLILGNVRGLHCKLKDQLSVRGEKVLSVPLITAQKDRESTLGGDGCCVNRQCTGLSI